MRVYYKIKHKNRRVERVPGMRKVDIRSTLRRPDVRDTSIEIGQCCRCALKRRCTAVFPVDKDLKQKHFGDSPTVM